MCSVTSIFLYTNKSVVKIGNSCTNAKSSLHYSYNNFLYDKRHHVQRQEVGLPEMFPPT